jgi:hypothetical protein
MPLEWTGRHKESTCAVASLPATQRQRCGKCHDLFRLRADVDRKLDGCINNKHPATADNGCAAAWPGPWREHCRTGGWSRHGDVAPRPRGGSAGRGSAPPSGVTQEVL